MQCPNMSEYDAFSSAIFPGFSPFCCLPIYVSSFPWYAKFCMIPEEVVGLSQFSSLRIDLFHPTATKYWSHDDRWKKS